MIRAVPSIGRGRPGTASLIVATGPAVAFQLTVTARRSGGRWLIADIDSR